MLLFKQTVGLAKNLIKTPHSNISNFLSLSLQVYCVWRGHQALPRTLLRVPRTGDRSELSEDIRSALYCALCSTVLCCITPLPCTVVYCAAQAWEGACKHSSNITAVSTSQCYHHHHQWPCDTHLATGRCHQSGWHRHMSVSGKGALVQWHPVTVFCNHFIVNCCLSCDIVTPGDGFIMTVGHSVRKGPHSLVCWHLPHH